MDSIICEYIHMYISKKMDYFFTESLAKPCKSSIFPLFRAVHMAWNSDIISDQAGEQRTAIAITADMCPKNLPHSHLREVEIFKVGVSYTQ